MKLLPFDLQKAEAGAKVFTANERLVTGLFRLPGFNEHLFAIFDGVIHAWTREGHSDIPGDCLRIAAPEPVVRWVNFFAEFGHAFHYDTQEVADRYAAMRVREGFADMATRLYGRAIRVEIEPGGEL
jgi:hypothetical protein